MKTPPVGPRSVQPAVPTESAAAPASASPPRSIVFVIPVFLGKSQPAATPVATGAATTKGGAVLGGAKLDVDGKVVGTAVPPEAIEVLRNAFKSEAGAFAVTDAQVLAAKRALLTFWGFPKAFVKDFAPQMKLDQVPGTDGAVDDSGRLTGNIGSERFEGWVASNDDWTKKGIETVMSGAERPASSITVAERFYINNGIAKADAPAVEARLFATLSQWRTVPDSEIAWAKEVLVKGFGLEGAIKLSLIEGFDSAVNSDSVIKGQIIDEKNVRNFSVAMSRGTVATIGNGWHLKLGSTDGNLP